MDKEVIFLVVIALFALGFCVVNIVSYLANKSHSKETQGTIISLKTLNPSTEKMRNSKWAIVTYNVAGKNYTSKKQIQVSMSADIGSHVQVRYDTNQPEKLYCFSTKRIAISALIVIGCLLIIGFKIVC
ncbi:hypothetical protein NDGK_02565 [Clostridiales bacterium CHKCI001]|nr:hypothetical protein NDGK_02565 [Clostridiales bacterium CHKCI001]